jgi:hypothetical protein
MARITIDIGTRERLEPAISKATPLAHWAPRPWSGSAPPASAAAPPRCGYWPTP